MQKHCIWNEEKVRPKMQNLDQQKSSIFQRVSNAKLPKSLSFVQEAVIPN